MAHRELEGVTLDYDAIADVLHVSFGIDEPYYCRNYEDIILVKRGMDLDVAIGLEILDVKHHGAERIDALLKKVLQHESRRADKRPEWYQSRVRQMEGRSVRDLVPA